MKAQHVRARRILSLCCIAAGVILLLYPQIREWAGRYEVESQAEAYQGRMAQETDGRLREMWDSAERYNRELSRGAAVLTDPFLSEVRQQEQEYEAYLDRLKEWQANRDYSYEKAQDQQEQSRWEEEMRRKWAQLYQ